MDAESYLLLCQRYIELNPVREGMVDDPAHHRWSSYCANGLGQPDPWLTTHLLYMELGSNDEGRRDQYRALFRSELDCASIDRIRLSLNQSQSIGKACFHATIETVRGSVDKRGHEGGRARKSTA